MANDCRWFYVTGIMRTGYHLDRNVEPSSHNGRPGPGTQGHPPSDPESRSQALKQFIEVRLRTQWLAVPDDGDSYSHEATDEAQRR
ncbi:hypothetical protein VTH82DRAFT_224 [Thermothelomyces myriococcoides]